ncbi:MAG: hypothetical protein IIB89_01570 [Chloroflexi bacterium]|nr:hypothetical protein [Chloroflexota bacterium]
MKRKWLMLPLVTGILAAGLTGASVLAHDEDGENVSPKETVAAKVAEILGIEDAQTVQDALQLATQEVRLERLEHRLDHMVEAGVLTQDQADAYLEWYEARPEGPNLHRNGHRLFGFGGGGDGEDGGPRQSFGQRFGGQEFPGQGELRSRFEQRFGGQEFPGQGELRSRFEQRFEGQDFPGQGELRSRFDQRFEGQEFPGRGELRSKFGQRHNGQQIPGQEQLPPGVGGEVPEGTGTSY